MPKIPIRIPISYYITARITFSCILYPQRTYMIFVIHINDDNNNNNNINNNRIHSSISTEWLFICWNPSYWCIWYKTFLQHRGDNSPTVHPSDCSVSHLRLVELRRSLGLCVVRVVFVSELAMNDPCDLSSGVWISLPPKSNRLWILVKYANCNYVD